MSDNTENVKIIEPEQSEVKKKKARKQIGLFILFALIVGGLYFIYYVTYASHYESTENAYVTGNQTAVTSQIGGSITNIAFTNTSKVEKGQILVEFEATDYILALEGAKIGLAQSVRDYYALGSNVDSYNNALREAQNNLNNVQKIYNRNHESYKAGIISRQNMEASTTQLQNAKLVVSQRQTALRNAKLQANSKDVYSHPAVQSSILKYKQASLNLSRTKIYSPVNGTIAKKSISVGQKISNGYPLFSVIDLENEWVEVNLKENQMKKIQIGATVELTSSLNGKTYKGYVVGVAAGTGNAFSLLPPQNASGNWIKITQRVPVRVVFDKESLEKNGLLPLGTTMEAIINTSDIVDEEDLPILEYNSSNPYILDAASIKKTINKIIKENSN